IFLTFLFIQNFATVGEKQRKKEKVIKIEKEEVLDNLQYNIVEVITGDCYKPETMTEEGLEVVAALSSMVSGGMEPSSYPLQKFEGDEAAIKLKKVEAKGTKEFIKVTKKKNLKKNEKTKYELIPSTRFIRKHPGLFPTIIELLSNLVQDVKIETIHVGKTFEYHSTVLNRHYEDFHSSYLKYFIMKHLATKYDVKLRDYRAEHIVAHAEGYQTGRKPALKAAIKKHYQTFINKQTKAIDINYSIKIVSLSYLIYRQRWIPGKQFYTRSENLLSIMKYLDSLPYNKAEIYPELNCEYFQTVGIITFDDKVHFETKVSKYCLLDESVKTKYKYKKKFFQSILHSFSYYKRTGKKILKFVIYNPLLGYEYVMKLNDIDFKLIEEALRKDITAFQSNKFCNSKNKVKEILY
uniref:Uncharacterized protein n=1 Tax=Glossina brevipalpis TaxID=37001 RepID=A0A1A9WNU4_9MUSC